MVWNKHLLSDDGAWKLSLTKVMPTGIGGSVCPSSKKSWITLTNPPSKVKPTWNQKCIHHKEHDTEKFSVNIVSHWLWRKAIEICSKEQSNSITYLSPLLPLLCNTLWAVIETEATCESISSTHLLRNKSWKYKKWHDWNWPSRPRHFLDLGKEDKRREREGLNNGARKWSLKLLAWLALLPKFWPREIQVVAFQGILRVPLWYLMLPHSMPYQGRGQTKASWIFVL